ncbi:MAG: isochorismatase family protein [Neisseria sp.]|nr:isochorismatase family protein [Neisseria sp.]
MNTQNFNTENTLCLVVDIQERLLPVMHEGGLCVEKTVLLLQGLKALGVPLAVCEQYPKGLGHTVEAVKAELDGVNIVEKTVFSAFRPEIETILREKNIRNVVLAGIETHVCMLQTAQDLRSAGFEVAVPFECTTSRDPLNKANALEQMRGLGVTVSNVESLLFMLLGDAGHPSFKTVSKLIQ